VACFLFSSCKATPAVQPRFLLNHIISLRKKVKKHKAKYLATFLIILHSSLKNSGTRFFVTKSKSVLGLEELKTIAANGSLIFQRRTPKLQKLHGVARSAPFYTQMFGT